MQLTALIGKKSYQKQGFLQDGTRVPLTAVSALGNFVTQVKTIDKEGYNSLQLGIDIKKKARKSQEFHSKKAGLKHTPRFFKEIRVEDISEFTPGMEIKVSDVFQPGDVVDVTGISKGKGFAGGVKRYGFKGGPRTHGQSDRERAPGSIGQTTTPGRVYKGKRMAGRMGQDSVTVKNLEIIEVTADGVLLIKGLVPGSVNTVLVVKKVGENKKFVPLYKEVKETESSSRLSSSDDAKQNLEETPSSELASLSDSSATKSEETQEISSEPAVNSSEGEQAPVAAEPENKEEAKEEVKENAG